MRPDQPEEDRPPPLPEWLALLAQMTADLPNVTIDSSAGQLLVDYCRQTGIGVIVRGTGTPGDLEHAVTLDLANRDLGHPRLVGPRQLLDRLLGNGRSNTDDDTCVVGIQLR